MAEFRRSAVERFPASRQRARFAICANRAKRSARPLLGSLAALYCQGARVAERFKGRRDPFNEGRGAIPCQGLEIQGGQLRAECIAGSMSPRSSCSAILSRRGFAFTHWSALLTLC